MYTQAGSKKGVQAANTTPLKSNEKKPPKCRHRNRSHYCFFLDKKPKIAFLISTGCTICSLIFFPIFFHAFSPQCVTVIWHSLVSSRRRVSTSARQTISACTARAATAVTASSQERWSPLWDARTTPSALSAVFAGT